MSSAILGSNRNKGIVYPDSDGKPMGETDYHMESLMYLREAMQAFFREMDVYVATKMFLYYEKGNVKARMAPDVMVVPGVDKHFRRSFKLDPTALRNLIWTLK